MEGGYDRELETAAQARDEGLGKIGFAHFFLGSGDIVGDAVVADGTLFAVVNGVVGSGVAVSGLAHTAGIDKQSFLSQLNGDVDWEFHKLAVHG